MSELWHIRHFHMALIQSRRTFANCYIFLTSGRVYIYIHCAVMETSQGFQYEQIKYTIYGFLKDWD